MAFSKANKYEIDAQRFNELTRAVSHPARQKILEQLRDEGEQNVKSLRKGHPICMATFSGHLKPLRKLGLVTWEERYPHTYYNLDWHEILEAKKFIISFFDGFEIGAIGKKLL